MPSSIARTRLPRLRSAFATCAANLFVSDGSQFTTGAAENPTLTIVALAIPQADHIASELGKGST